MKSAKTKLTKETILKAVADGAKTMTDIAHKHGYIGNVSGDVTKVIRQLVPKIGELLADAKVKKVVPVTPSVPVVVEPPAVVVTQRKALYKGPVYGRVFETAVQIGKEHGEQHRSHVVELVSRKTELTETQVEFALRVFTTQKHKSNNGRSINAAKTRGNVLLVPCEAAG